MKRSLDRKKPVRLSPNALESVPVRSAELTWRTKEDGTVEVDVEHRGFFDRLAQTFFKKPRVSHIALDQRGSAVWLAMDGERTLADVVSLMGERYPEETERMLDRVVTFTATLCRCRWVSLQKPRGASQRAKV